MNTIDELLLNCDRNIMPEFSDGVKVISREASCAARLLGDTNAADSEGKAVGVVRQCLHTLIY